MGHLKRLGLGAIALSAVMTAGSAWAAELSHKESFLLMFGKGNGAMRVLCALQRQGVIDQATRQRWIRDLESLLAERGDSDADRRNTRIGMAFADSRSSLCPQRLMGGTDP
jgi:hypothetical protein